MNRLNLKKILVIDDEPRIRTLYNHLLKEEGYQVVEAPDGESGLSILRQNKDIRLVILDILLPIANGLEIFETIKNEFSEKKIIVSSVYSQDDQEFLLDGADDYYYKSENTSVLVEKIKHALETSNVDDLGGSNAK